MKRETVGSALCALIRRGRAARRENVSERVIVAIEMVGMEGGIKMVLRNEKTTIQHVGAM
jgi:hypothetical protein